MTWSAPDRLQACSLPWSSAAAPIAAGRAGHLVDQLLRSPAHQADTQTPTQTPTRRTWSTSCCSSHDFAPGDGQPLPAAGARAGQVDQVLQDPADHVPGAAGGRSVRLHPAHHPAKPLRTAQDASGAANCCGVAAPPPARVEPAEGPLMPLGRGGWGEGHLPCTPGLRRSPPRLRSMSRALL